MFHSPKKFFDLPGHFPVHWSSDIKPVLSLNLPAECEKKVKNVLKKKRKTRTHISYHTNFV